MRSFVPPAAAHQMANMSEIAPAMVFLAFVVGAFITGFFTCLFLRHDRL